MKRTSRRVKLIDVARAANVSASTVSRLMRGRSGVAPGMRDRIIKAAVKLGFDLEAGKKSRIIAFLLSNRSVLHPFHSAVLMGAEAYAAEHDYGVLFLRVHYSSRVPWRELRLRGVLERPQIISGAIVAGTNSPNLLELLTSKGIPWVVLGNNVTDKWQQAESNAVFFDDVGGAAEITFYLQSLGHSGIAFVGNLRLPWYARRYEGYESTMREAGLTPRLGEVNSNEAEEMGYLGTKLILQGDSPVTAIFAGDDTVAQGAYKALRDRGLNIPAEISVVGFNDTPEASALLPPLTSVRVYTDQIGKQMAELLLKRIARPDLRAESVMLPTQVVKRESCASPAKKALVHAE
jgi:DNA-binding LacI/PurR family transcriptional regulator